MTQHTKYTYYSPHDSEVDKDSMKLGKYLYRKRMTVQEACKDLGIDFEEEMLGDLEQCTSCSVWWHTHELLEDPEDGTNLCKYCESYYSESL
jgi:hypothetical protein